MLMRLIRSVGLALVGVLCLFSSAQGQMKGIEGRCVNANIISGRLITDVCWSCIFPIRIAGINISGSSDGFIPRDAARMPVCFCKDNLGVPRPGITTSMWEPFRLVEFQTTPGCSSVLNGVRLPMDPLNRGSHGNGEIDGTDPLFLHYHYYAFPLMLIMDLFDGSQCNAGGYVDLDLMYLSEMDPTWNNDELAFFTNPEAALVANPIATLACIPDALSTIAGPPIKELFWCAGSWGSMYPLSGNHSGGNGVLQDSSLLSARVLAALHRRGLAWGTVGEDQMCGGSIKPVLPKDQYKFTMIHPVPETSSSHPIGQTTLIWGPGRIIPGVGEDPIYIIWRWKDCCNS